MFICGHHHLAQISLNLLFDFWVWRDVNCPVQYRLELGKFIYSFYFPVCYQHLSAHLNTVTLQICLQWVSLSTVLTSGSCLVSLSFLLHYKMNLAGKMAKVTTGLCILRSLYHWCHRMEISLMSKTSRKISHRLITRKILRMHIKDFSIYT